MATVKSHYDDHLAGFYSWMTGNFTTLKAAFGKFCDEHGIASPGKALDLGCGSGIQSVALAERGFEVTALDFNGRLLAELNANRGDLPVTIVEADMRAFSRHTVSPFDLILCCGDTLSHLDTFHEVDKLLADIHKSLQAGGKVVLTFRDYAVGLEDTGRFIPVKSDGERILTCFLEYFPGKVRVTDLLHEKAGDGWIQKVSSYEKLRLTRIGVIDSLKRAGFAVL
ncbi:MAG TPA: class I SAM-dependent methyltransferase, partial [Chryseosolibacter sp.]|nr:class I SAM-dependent methyltransferase [Chryseosolibacter sp.]